MRPGRRRLPQRSAAQRQPLPSTIPRAAKHARGRHFDVTPPAHVRVFGAALHDQDRDEIARRLGMRLGKFASSIERISVRLSDVNGPRGGVDHRCVVKVAKGRSARPQRAPDDRDVCPEYFYWSET